MKVLHISFADNGGAGTAALRIHLSLLSDKKLNIDSKMIVSSKKTNYDSIFLKNNWKFYPRIRGLIGSKISLLQKTSNPVIHSVSFLPGNFHKIINNSDADIINLHWIQNEMISIENIGKIKKPIFWNFHDSWAFCGSEHYPFGLSDNRYINGYLRNNRNINDKYFDLNRWCWKRKLCSWKNDITVICASNWLAKCAKLSLIAKNWDVNVIPYPLNTEIFKPYSKSKSKDFFKIPKEKNVILFGAVGGRKDFRKGFDLLEKALQHISSDIKDSVLVIFGESNKTSVQIDIGIPSYSVGKISDQKLMAKLYSAADLMIVPSRMEAFGQTASEAASCGTPVVAFDCTGLKDIVDDGETGFLIEPYKEELMGEAIKKLILSKSLRELFGKNARKKVIKEFSYKRISNLYKEKYLAKLQRMHK